MKIGDKVRFMDYCANHSNAVDMFGVEPQCNYPVHEIYTELLEGTIVWNSGLIIAVTDKMQAYDISKNGCNKRFAQLKFHVIQIACMNFDEWIKEEIDDGNINCIEDFFKCEIINKNI